MYYNNKHEMKLKYKLFCLKKLSKEFKFSIVFFLRMFVTNKTDVFIKQTFQYNKFC